MPKAEVVPIRTTLKVKSLQDEVDRHRAYILAIDPVIEPVTDWDRNSLHRDGFIPGFILVKMMALAQERASKPKREPLKSRFLRWVKLGVFGEKEAV